MKPAYSRSLVDQSLWERRSMVEENLLVLVVLALRLVLMYDFAIPG